MLACWLLVFFFLWSLAVRGYSVREDTLNINRYQVVEKIDMETMRTKKGISNIPSLFRGQINVIYFAMYGVRVYVGLTVMHNIVIKWNSVKTGKKGKRNDKSKITHLRN